MALTNKQRIFVAEYLRTMNATQAAKAAGYSERTAGAIGCENLAKPEIAELIRTEVERRFDVSPERIRRELVAVGFAQMRDLVTWGNGKVRVGFTEDGKRLPPSEIMDAAVILEVEEPYVRPINSEDLGVYESAAVAEVSLGREGFKVKMHSKLDALDKLAKMLGYYAPEKHVLTGADGAPIDLDVGLSPADAYRKMKDGG